MNATVERMRDGLERAMRRAGQAADRDLAERVRLEGHRLVFLLNGLMHSTRMYELDNDALAIPAEELASVVAGLHHLLGAIHVVCVEDQIYLNDVRLRVTASEQEVVDHLIAELGRHHVGGISIHAPITAEALKVVAKSVAGREAAEQPRESLARRLGGAGDVELSGRYTFRVRGQAPAEKRSYAAAVRRGSRAVAEALANLAAGRLPNPLPVRRAVIDLADALRQDPDLAAVESVRSRPLASGEHHLLSVCSLSVALGRALGLSEAALSDLGVAAMMHDIGLCPGPGGAHPESGVRPLLRQRGFHEAKVRRLLVALEHHVRHGSDAARDWRTARPSLFSRIVHIADDYDLLTARRPGMPGGISPATALAAMWAARGREYDPQLLALFVQILGRYPPGTLLELADGRWAVSISGGRDEARFEWPVVRIVRAADGSPRDANEELDLYESRDRLRIRPIPSADGEAVDGAIEARFGSDSSVPT